MSETARRKLYLAPLILACIYLVLRIASVAYLSTNRYFAASSLVMPVVIGLLLILGAVIVRAFGRFLCAAAATVLAVQSIIAYAPAISAGVNDVLYITVNSLQIVCLIIIALSYFIGGRVMSVLKLVFSIIYLSFIVFWAVRYALTDALDVNILLINMLVTAVLGVYFLLRPCVRQR